MKYLGCLFMTVMLPLCFSEGVRAEAEYLSARIENQPEKGVFFKAGTAYSMARPWATLKQDPDALKRAPQVSSAGDPFRLIRWDRFLHDSQRAGRSRRIPWYYPDDGCFYRAEKAVQRLRAQGHVAPAKIFAFASLRVNTDHHPRGRVGWWYHVAPGVRVGQTLYVLDPAIQLGAPLTMDAWLSLMNAAPGSVKVSVCSPSAYGPSSVCHRGGELSDADMQEGEEAVQPEWGADEEARSPYDLFASVGRFFAATNWLSLEWARVRALGMDPYETL